MTPTQDYIFRFARDYLHMAGRCRVRIYERKNRAHTVLLTELNDNPGESIASASEQIVTELAARWKLSAPSTRWIHHDATHENGAPQFDELEFDWDSNRVANQPRARRLSESQVEELTGADLATLERRIGDLGLA